MDARQVSFAHWTKIIGSDQGAVQQGSPVENYYQRGGGHENYFIYLFLGSSSCMEIFFWDFLTNIFIAKGASKSI